jgi:hypothetical protein
VLAHRDGTPSLEEAGAQVRAGVRQDVVVWRSGEGVQLREALPGEVVLLQRALNGADLAAALDAADGLDFSQWFPLAVQSALVLAVTDISKTTTT